MLYLIALKCSHEIVKRCCSIIFTSSINFTTLKFFKAIRIIALVATRALRLSLHQLLCQSLGCWQILCNLQFKVTLFKVTLPSYHSDFCQFYTKKLDRSVSGAIVAPCCKILKSWLIQFGDCVCDLPLFSFRKPWSNTFHCKLEVMATWKGK